MCIHLPPFLSAEVTGQLTTLTCPQSCRSFPGRWRSTMMEVWRTFWVECGKKSPKSVLLLFSKEKVLQLQYIVLNIVQYITNRGVYESLQRSTFVFLAFLLPVFSTRSKVVKNGVRFFGAISEIGQTFTELMEDLSNWKSPDVWFFF